MNDREALVVELAKAYEDGYRYRQERNRAETELELLKAKHNPFHGLWQDAEGTIPVTVAGQPVGLIKESEMSEVKNVQPAP